LFLLHDGTESCAAFVTLVEVLLDVQVLGAPGASLEDDDTLQRLVKPMVSSDVDASVHRVHVLKGRLDVLAKELSEVAGSRVSVAWTDMDGWHLTCSPLAAKVISQRCKVYRLRVLKSSARITSPMVEEVSDELQKERVELRVRVDRLLEEWVYARTSARGLLVAARGIAELDVVQSHARCAELYGWVRPEVVLRPAGAEGGSAVWLRGLRHPILENAHECVRYVPHDVELGDKVNGIVLYSVNSGGKTSLLKSVALAVIMAQAGCRVAASGMRLVPFTDLVTQVDFQDDMFRGHSSFVVEMMGLSVILRRACESTLVVCDEVTKGTEVRSGTALFAATVCTLLNRGARFVFSTHLHGACQIERLRQHPRLRVCHLGVKTDEHTGAIVFTRELQEGPGESVYGIEIAKAVVRDRQFIALAEVFREQQETQPQRSLAVGGGQDVSDGSVGGGGCGVGEGGGSPPPLLVSDTATRARRSRYNTRKLVSKCELCGYRPVQKTDCPLDVHHLEAQVNADEMGKLPSGGRVNALYNLAALCKQCHDKVHREALRHSYKHTTHGVRLSSV
jgi:DNA mismatch repair protein MutS